MAAGCGGDETAPIMGRKCTNIYQRAFLFSSKYIRQYGLREINLEIQMAPSAKRTGSILILSFMAIPVFFMTPAKASGKDINLSVGLGFEFATGKYGTDVTTDSISIPLTVRYYPTERLDLELVIPYVYQSNGTTTSAGMFRFKSGRSTIGSNGSGSGGQGQSQDRPESDISRSQSGIGDVTLKAGYIPWREGAVSPQVKALFYVQLPTADEDKGLGTGEFTEGLGLELSKWFDDWYAYAESKYNFQGSSPELALKDFVSYEGGVAYQVSDRFRPTVLVKGATAPSDYSSSLAEARLEADYRLTGRAGIESYLAAGLTGDSSDFGAGISVFYDF
jgi:hypothetical protein